MTTTSPIDGKPIEAHEKIASDWYHAFRMWYAHLIISRAETPSTLSEVNNCRHCSGTNLLHHCLFDQSCGPDARTEECLHPSEQEWKEFQDLCTHYRIKFTEAKFASSMPSMRKTIADLFGASPVKYPKLPIGGI